MALGFCYWWTLTSSDSGKMTWLDLMVYHLQNNLKSAHSTYESKVIIHVTTLRRDFWGWSVFFAPLSSPPPPSPVTTTNTTTSTTFVTVTTAALQTNSDHHQPQQKHSQSRQKKRTTKPEKEKRKQKEKERRKSLRKKEKKTQRKTKYKSSSKDYISQLPIIKIEFHHIQHFKTHTTFYPPSSNLKEDSFSSIYQL